MYVVLELSIVTCDHIVYVFVDLYTYHTRLSKLLCHVHVKGPKKWNYEIKCYSVKTRA